MLKENEYIRTDLGNILKYTGKEKEFIDKHLSISNKKDIEFLGTIVKHSKDITDLIEVGDLINKSEVYELGQTDNGQKWIKVCNGYLYFENDLLRQTILTKEQYMQNCYKIDTN